MSTELMKRMGAALRYDPLSGLLTWAEPTARNVTRGAPAGNLTSGGYLHLKFGGRRYLAHRVAWLLHYGEWPAGVIDHINGIKTDNRQRNLRDCSPAINAQNQRRAHAGNASGVLGVTWRQKKGRWAASIKHGGRSVHLGYFPTQDEARAAYVEAKRLHHPGCML